MPLAIIQCTITTSTFFRHASVCISPDKEYPFLALATGNTYAWYYISLDPSPLLGTNVHSWDHGYLELLVAAHVVTLRTLLVQWSHQLYPVHVCVCVNTCVRSVHAHVLCVYVCVCVNNIPVHVYIREYVCVCVSVHVCARVHVYVCVCVCVCVCKHMNRY